HAAISGAVKLNGKTLKEQQIVFLGAGSAATGVADELREAMKVEGLSDTEARNRVWFIDSKGLIHSGRADLTPEKLSYAQPQDRVLKLFGATMGERQLADVIAKIDATILIGLSTVVGAFSEAIVREMARKVERPIIFPLSNPTSKSEATAGG